MSLKINSDNDILRIIIIVMKYYENEKSARRDANTALAVVRRSQKFSPRHRAPSRGHRTAKI